MNKKLLVFGTFDLSLEALRHAEDVSVNSFLVSFSSTASHYKTVQSKYTSNKFYQMTSAQEE